jgi:cytochrome c-type biogenesis protein CcmH
MMRERKQTWKGMGRALSVLALAVTVVLSMGAGDKQSRFNDLGHKMMCHCGCGQILLECNHVGCQDSERMRGELTAALDRGDNDDLILQGFVQKYGATVLAAPMMTAFDNVSWIVPVGAFIFGLLALALIVRLWRNRPVATPVAVGIPVTEVDKFRAQARQETEL